MTKIIQHKYFRITIYIVGLFLFQEMFFRFCFPLPELSNFDRITYMMWEKDKIGQYRHQRNQNWHWESLIDTNHTFEHRMNLYGFRDKEWEIENTSGKPRVLFIGDSFIEGIMSTQNQTIPTAFNQASNNQFEVFNGGMMGCGIESYLQLAVDAIPIFKPNYIVFAISSNDLSQKKTWIPEQYLTPKYFNYWNPRLLETMDQINLDTPIKARWANSSKPYIPTIEAKHHPWHNKPEVLTKHVTPEVADHMKKGTYSPFRVNNLFNEEQMLQLPPQLGDVIPFLSDFCKKFNATPIVIYIPTKNLVTNYYLSFEKASCLVKCNDSIDLNQEKYQIHQRLLAQKCLENDVQFINLTPMIKAQENKNNHLYWNYDDHMKAKGYLFAGQQLYENWIKMP